MAQADSGKHDGTAFVFSFPASSRKCDANRTRYGLSHPGWAALWALGLVTGTLGNALGCIDASALARFSRHADGQLASWVVALFGYALIALAARTAFDRNVPGMGRLVNVAALSAWTYHLLLLRWPWLVGTATASDRLSVASAALSQGWEGIPIYAFLELLATALLYTHATVFLILSARGHGWLPEHAVKSRGSRVLIAAAMGLYCLDAYVTVSLAQGRC